MKFFTLFFLSALVSCSTTKLYTPMAKMLSPESPGKKGRGFFEGRFAAYKQDKADFSDNTTNGKPVAELRSVKYLPSFNAEVGLLDRLDVYANPNFLYPAPTIVGLKYQVLGAAANEAKRKNFSLAIHVGFGRQNSGSKDSSAFIQFGDHDYGDNVKRIGFKTEHREVGLVMGYRWTDFLVHYMGGYYYHQDVTGHISTINYVLDNKRFDYVHTGVTYSTGVIHYLDEKFYYKVDLSHLTSDFSFASAHSSNSVNAAFGFYW